MPTKGIVTLTETSVRKGSHLVLDQLSLTVQAGETLALFGPNGSGKSTLLSVLGGMITLTAGKREICTLGARDLIVGYAPDHLPKLKFTAREYLSHMAAIRGIPAGARKERIGALLERIGLMDQPGLQMRHFSKGMLQKVNLIQSILVMPDLLLLDEPVSGLDATAVGIFGDILADAVQEGTAVVMAIHEQEWALARADRILQLGGGQARLREPEMMQSALEWRFITCRWPAHARELDATALEGVLSVRREQQAVHYWVKLTHSDAFLMALLQMGATVLTVSEGKGVRAEWQP